MKYLLVAVFLWGVFLSAPLSIEAAGLVPCGGVGEAQCQSCDVVKLANNVIGWLVAVLGIIAAIIIVYAGVKLVTAGGNGHAMEEAKSMMTNLIIGYIIVLAGWLIIDYGMKALVTEATFGVWNEIQCKEQPVAGRKTRVTINYDSLEAVLVDSVQGWVPSSNSKVINAACSLLPGPPGVQVYDCTKQKTQCINEGAIATVSADGSQVSCAPPTGGSTGGLNAQCSSGNSACSVSVLQSAGLSSEEANVMSCIAITESSGIPSSQSNTSSACGTFQITEGTWSDFNNDVSSSCTSFSSCTNASCNIEVMVNIVDSVKYARWTCPGCNKSANSCIDAYGG